MSSKLKKLSYLYISLPLVLFGLFWLKAGWSLLLTGALIFALYRIFSEIKTTPMSKEIRRFLIIWGGVAFAWVFCSGIGGYFFQSGDFSARNAVFRDLINYDWPVFYSNVRAMNYYFGFWLPPALLTKLISGFVSGASLFTVGLNLLMIWTFLGVFLFLLLIADAETIRNKKRMWLCLALPIGFAGLDYVGGLVFGQRFLFHLEWWTDVQYSSLTTCLFWVFNQTVISWLATVLFFYERRIENFGILFVCCLFSGPLPAIGLGLLMLAWCGKECIDAVRTHQIKSFVKKALSVQNIIACGWLIVLYTFFSINAAGNKFPFAVFPWDWDDYLWFIFIEFALYVLCIFPMFKKDILFWAMVASLCTLCWFKVGGYGDFAMRTTIPPLVLLMLYILKYLRTCSGKRFETMVLIAALLIGLMVPVREFSRGVVWIIGQHTIYHREDNFWTFRNKNINLFPFFNYLTEHAGNTPFYLYFGKGYFHEK